MQNYRNGINADKEQGKKENQRPLETKMKNLAPKPHAVQIKRPEGSKAIFDSDICISGLVAASTFDIEKPSIGMVKRVKSHARDSTIISISSPPSSFQQSLAPV